MGFILLAIVIVGSILVSIIGVIMCAKELRDMRTYTTEDIRFNGRNGAEWCGVGDVADLEEKLAAAEKRIEELEKEPV